MVANFERTLQEKSANNLPLRGLLKIYYLCLATFRNKTLKTHIKTNFIALALVEQVEMWYNFLWKNSQGGSIIGKYQNTTRVINDRTAEQHLRM